MICASGAGAREGRGRRLSPPSRGCVFPQLEALPGFLGASLLQRDDGRGAEVLVMTKWASIEAVMAFAGARAREGRRRAEARAVLASFDDFVTHHEVVAELAPQGRLDGDSRSA